ncbi:hypothetical protein Tco_0983832 [Tanacetum coccineum]
MREKQTTFSKSQDETIIKHGRLVKELFMKCPQHYLTEMHETAEDAKKAIQEMAKYSQKWHNRTSRGRSTETPDGWLLINSQLEQF